MKLDIPFFRGEQPVLGRTKLPEGVPSSAVNSRVVTGDLSSFKDIGNPFQLSKAAPIVDIFLIKDKWLQWSSSEVSYGGNIDVSPGIIPGDTTYRTFMSGLSGGLRQTNYFYATDPSQQGSNVLGAYPYVTFPVGDDNPTTAPTAVPAGAGSASAAQFEYAQEVQVNNLLVAAGGTGYKTGDILTLAGGTLSNALPAATIKVTSVDTAGAIDGISLQTGGFYTVGPTGTQGVTGGTGTAATFSSIALATQSFNGLVTQPFDNGKGRYAIFSVAGTQLEIASGRGDLTVAYTSAPMSLSTADSFTYQLDGLTNTSGDVRVPDLVFYLPGSPFGVTTGGAFTGLGGGALVLSYYDSTFKLYTSVTGTEGGAVSGTVVSSAAVTVAGNTMYRVKVTGVKQSSSSTPGFSITATVALQSTPSTIIATLTGFVPYNGESLGFGTNHRSDAGPVCVGRFENFYITVQQPVAQATQESTSYVYTYVTTFGSPPNQITQESGPSNPSDTISITIDSSTNPATLAPVAVSIPATPMGSSVAFVNLYRLVLQADGSEVYQFDVQLPASSSGPILYTDTKLDSELGPALASSTYAPPASNIEGITALPNGVMAGFFGNTLALSETNFPFAYPVENQYATDTNIVGIAAIDTTVLVLTNSHPYTAFGSDPSQYTMSKETSAQGCVSKRSISTHKRLGVIYSTGNGLCYYRGQGNLDLIRQSDGNPLFTYEQWQAFNPSSILGVVHDDYYWFWYDATSIGGGKGGYLLDIPSLYGQVAGRVAGGFGVIKLDFHATAAYVDPVTDKMFFTPDLSAYPINGSVISSASNVLSQWEGDSLNKRTQVWTREEILLPRDAAFMLFEVDADDYTNINVTLSSETGVAFNGVVTNERPQIMAPRPAKRWKVVISGTSTINRITLAEKSDELNT